MAKRKRLMNEIRQELRRNQTLNVLYQRELTRLQLANQITKLREERKLSQTQLARRIGTQQSAVARTEQTTYRGQTVSTLAKIAAVVGQRLEVRFVPGRRGAAGAGNGPASGGRLRGVPQSSRRASLTACLTASICLPVREPRRRPTMERATTAIRSALTTDVILRPVPANAGSSVLRTTHVSFAGNAGRE